MNKKRIARAIEILKKEAYTETGTKESAFLYVAINALSNLTVESWTVKLAIKWIERHLSNIKKMEVSK